MVVGLIASIVILAAVTMYLTSMEAWSQAGARLALQQNADRVIETIASEIRSATSVSVTPDSLSLTILKKVAVGDSTVGVYTYEANELKNMHDVVLLDHISWLRFDTSYGGIKARVRMTLDDDMDTPALPYDDVRIQMESAAICRNRLVW